MSKYNNTYITAPQFEVMVEFEQLYEGFVIGVGYAYVSYGSIPPRNDLSYSSPQRIPYNESYHTTFFTQQIDTSKEAVALSLQKQQIKQPNPDAVKRLLVKDNGNGTLTVNMGHGNKMTIPKDYQYVDVSFSGMNDSTKLTLSVSNKFTGEYKSITTKWSDFALTFGSMSNQMGQLEIPGEIPNQSNSLGNTITATGAITGSWEMHLARKLNRFRPIRMNDATLFRKGSIAINQESKALMTGSRYLQSLRGALFWTGIAAGAAGGFCSFYAYTNDEISGERLTADLFMTAIGFAGPVGLGVSTIYFLIMQPMEHHPTPSFIADPTSDYNRSARQDNTRYVNPYKPLY